MIDKAELAYQQLCGEITVEFNDCSKQVCFIVSSLKGKRSIIVLMMGKFFKILYRLLKWKHCLHIQILAVATFQVF